MKDKCSYCGKGDCIREVAFTNAEYYGGSLFNLPCKHCGKMLVVQFERVVKLCSIGKSDKKRSESDF